MAAVGGEPGDSNLHDAIPEMVTICRSVSSESVKSNGLKASVHDYICNNFPFSVYILPFALD